MIMDKEVQKHPDFKGQIIVEETGKEITIEEYGEITQWLLAMLEIALENPQNQERLKQIPKV